MKKRTGIKIISFSSAALIVAITFLFAAKAENERYKLEIENGYSRCLEEFSAGINNISLVLKKALYVTTPKQVSSMAAKLLTEAEISKNSLAQLPQGNELKSLNKFLSQVGNYAMAVSKSLISTGEISDKDIVNIESLSKVAEKVAGIVSEAQITYNNLDYWAKEVDNEIDNAVDGENLTSSLDELESQLTDYPTLVYDGPYSDHIFEKEPEMIKNAEKVTESEALKKAAQTIECEDNYLKSDGTVLGSIPSYRFVGDGVTATVSINGGFPVYMRKERVIEESILSYEQAVEKAKRYLSRIEMNGFRETYYSTAEGICVVNFAYLDGETICYPDLIKVGVAMDSGEIMLYEASGYLANHTDRAFETPEHSSKEAKEVLSKNLNLQKTALALIPTDGTEVRCYELSCKTENGEEILVYINTNTLAEEDVLILLKSDGGTLVK